LNNNKFPQNAISHRELQKFLKNAKKDINSNEFSEQNKNNQEDKDFNDLIKNWTDTSQKILLMMNSQNKVFPKNKSSKSLIAFGAMGAHISMALQALKATECDQ
tara:strand:- start:512 stop:823 length:312 start_codon:yes stop_codon:yes gene_type:complete